MRRLILASLMVIALSSATVVPAFAGSGRHIHAACIPNIPPDEPAPVVVEAFDLPEEQDPFLTFSKICRAFGGHVVILRDFEDGH